MADATSTITLKFEEPQIVLPSRIVARMLEKIFDAGDPAPVPESEPAPAPVHTPAPEIGAAYQGGLYAGATLFLNCRYHLVLMPDEREDITWNDAIAWADQQLAILPSRIDLLILWQNLKSEFKSEPYWSCEQRAGDESYAWYQTFDLGGYQNFNYESSKLRARAVRRIPIE